jgi:hypothetical protein
MSKFYDMKNWVHTIIPKVVDVHIAICMVHVHCKAIVVCTV